MPDVSKAEAIKHGYTAGARILASRSVIGLARTRVTPNALTAAGVLLCGTASILVLFEHRNAILFYWLATFIFVVGSILDILDGALARDGGKTTPFGAFLDSTTDRVSEGFHADDNRIRFARHARGVRGGSRWRRSRDRSSCRTHARERRPSGSAAMWGSGRAPSGSP